MSMMRSRDPQVQEDGFHALLPHAAACVRELVAALHIERDRGLRCWLLELIGAARSPEALSVLVESLQSQDEGLRYWAIRGLVQLGTKEARRVLWEARSYALETPEATASLRQDLDRLVGKP